VSSRCHGDGTRCPFDTYTLATRARYDPGGGPCPWRKPIP
jgi:hypothetical protein